MIEAVRVVPREISMILSVQWQRPTIVSTVREALLCRSLPRRILLLRVGKCKEWSNSANVNDSIEMADGCVPPVYLHARELNIVS